MSHNNHMLDAGWLQAAGEQTIGTLVRKEYDALDKASPDFLKAFGDLRADFFLAGIAKRLNPSAGKRSQAMIDEAARVIALPNASSKADTKRTLTQEQACGATRFAWFALLKRLDIETPVKQGGKREPKVTKAAPATKVANQAKPRVAPVTVDHAALVAAFQAEARVLMQLRTANKALFTPAEEAIVAAFVEAVNKLKATFEPEQTITNK